MSPTDILNRHRNEILKIAAKHGAYNIRLFGSLARGEATDESDIDLLVSMKKGRTYFDLVGLWQELEEFLGCKVDVLTDGAVNPYLKKQILAEARPL